ncbi:TM0106 family RecB-like putative nuclease [Rhodoplanes sp. Z2-YC6860]|uniref:TM0106 family RecB-like putative nuclease n=1 Tax=Rhodoplanes sp. Z2-YC6860 TaxID=674703 RepID=UPI00078D60C8|nr:TM0106 family RecB-like putative nuclease [Rhodoplanes sp. Z2-YC6860]AMN39051.1 RecB family nuclease [Rhodoplanes sp. Z2-YC6860]
MQSVGGTIHLFASDLVGHLNCRHLTELDLAVAHGELAKPSVWDPVLELLTERGSQHEQNYVDHLRTNGMTLAAVDGVGVDAASVGKTLHEMRAGTAIIVQGALQAGRWGGRADVLRRVEIPSALGGWSYEVVDTKLAKETKGNTVLQLCLYSDLLALSQGRIPESSFVVAPGTGFEPQEFRIADFSAYYRRVRASLERAVDQGPQSVYPEPKPHCEICRWRTRCDAKRREDDHLSLVANISKIQIGELERQTVGTTAALAKLSLPLPWKPDRGSAQSYTRIREQARIQVEGREQGKVIYEPLKPEHSFGLALLPEPSPGDIFLDFEGDPFVDGGGLEFLFGYAFRDDAGTVRYRADWALSRISEKEAFECFVDFVIERLDIHPGLHIYHFAPYEPAALKRLMGRYATREDELDRLLRSIKFVDLYAVVRHGIRASVESYSIKKLEPLYQFKRQLPLSDAGKTLAKVQACLELGDFDAITEQDQQTVEGYNRDDCLSAWKLRDWLEGVRTAVIQSGAAIDRPAPEPGEASEELTEWQEKVAALVSRLTHGVPIDPTERTAEQQARWLLANVIDFHRREAKSAWWEHFRLAALSAEDLLEERAALSELVFVEAAGGTTKAPIHRYQFPPQDTDIRGDEDLRMLGGEPFGSVQAISLEERTVDVKKRQDTASVHPVAVYAHKVISSQVLADSLFRIGGHVAENGISGNGPYQAARDLLLMSAPRTGGEPLRIGSETPLAAAVRVARALDGGTLPLQGPPGSGKTYTGAHMICALARSGQRMGITANSHKVIRNLLDETIKIGEELGVSIECVQLIRDHEEKSVPHLQFAKNNAKLLAALGTSCQVGGGTAWLWAHPNASEAVDVLFIDEAAQMSLASVLAASQAARTLVLLGDPRQLEQPLQGTHPEGTDVSALDHMLGDHATIPAERGLFLEETWRLHPNICAYTSELFYEGRLRSRAGLEHQRIDSAGDLDGSGLRYLPVLHEGNQNSSPEEADKIRELVEGLLKSGAKFTDKDGKQSPIGLDDVLIIAPYNAQVFKLQDRIPGGRIGTVDKFQGQQAPIVIYSMTTSTPADAPRGMEFLYSPNRLNVATSRAKALCILVGSPLLFEAECRTPRQMQLANAFCRYLEMATPLS